MFYEVSDSGSEFPSLLMKRERDVLIMEGFEVYVAGDIGPPSAWLVAWLSHVCRGYSLKTT